jgi:transcriptional regulator with XRE-family HTH domain
MEPLPNKTLGQHLRELRQKADLSLRDLGEKLKDPKTNTPVSAAFLSDIENGRRFPSDEMIEKLAEILGANVQELRSCDPRGPAKEIQDLATMNPKYAFAFRRAVDAIQGQNLTPQEFVRRIEDTNSQKFAQKFDQIASFPDWEEAMDRILAEMTELWKTTDPKASSTDKPTTPSQELPPNKPTSHDPQT